MIAGEVGLLPREGEPRRIYALAKRTFDVSRGLRIVEPEPLQLDPWAGDNPRPLQPGSDYWLDKPAADVTVEGSAFATRPVACSEVSIEVGRAVRRVRVFGRRALGWRAGRPILGSPEPFQEIPMTWSRAYGGLDLRVPMATPDSLPGFLRATSDHPGLYPRNPLGCGYLVEAGPVEGMELPNFEDPDDLLTAERLITRDPTQWWRQPMPACLAAAPPNLFFRYARMGVDAWFTPPDDERLAEVRRGILPRGFRRLFGAAPRVPAPGIFFQDAAPGLSFRDLDEGTPVTVRGMHPEGKVVHFALPASPRIEVALEGRVQCLPARLTRLAIRPAEERLTVTYAAVTERMHRIFLPGIHPSIPLAMRVDAGAWVPYRTPPTIRERQARAKAAAGGAPGRNIRVSSR